MSGLALVVDNCRCGISVHHHLTGQCINRSHPSPCSVKFPHISDSSRHLHTLCITTLCTYYCTCYHYAKNVSAYATKWSWWFN